MSAPYGELVVVLGDAHVGHRAIDIPDKFRKMLTPDKMQHLVCTGNLCSSETYDFCRSVAPKIHTVRGDMDDYSSSMTSAEELVFEVGEFRLGVCHGHQIVPWGDREALGLLARRLDVDILITGHTHVCEAFEVDGTWFVNPGSITGAYTPLRDSVRPSFVLLSIQANTVKLYMYELNAVSGEVDIRRAKFTKPSKNPFSSSISSPFPNPSPAKTEVKSVTAADSLSTQKRPQATISNATEPKADAPQVQKRAPAAAQEPATIKPLVAAPPPPTSFEDALPISKPQVNVPAPIQESLPVEAADSPVEDDAPLITEQDQVPEVDSSANVMLDVDLSEDVAPSAVEDPVVEDTQEQELSKEAPAAGAAQPDNLDRWDDV